MCFQSVQVDSTSNLSYYIYTYLEDTRIPQNKPAGVLVAPGGFFVAKASTDITLKQAITLVNHGGFES